MSDFVGIGPLLRAVMGPPAEAGPPWVYSFRPPEPVAVLDDGGWPVVDVFGEPVLRTPLLPSLTAERRRPVFTGCLAFLGEAEPR